MDRRFLGVFMFMTTVLVFIIKPELLEALFVFIIIGTIPFTQITFPPIALGFFYLVVLIFLINRSFKVSYLEKSTSQPTEKHFSKTSKHTTTEAESLKSTRASRRRFNVIASEANKS